MNDDDVIAGILVALLLSMVAVIGGLATVLTIGVQSDRDARRLDVIEQRLNIRGPDEPALTVDDLVATAIAEANK